MIDTTTVTQTVSLTETDKTVLFIDVETGGLEKESSLLSIGVVRWEDGNVTHEQEFFLRHKMYHVTAEGLGVNRIQLPAHHLIAHTPQEVAKMLKGWVEALWPKNSRVTLGGHNLALDVDRMQTLLNEYYQGYWKGRFSYRALDTTSLLIFLNHAGVTPPLRGLDQALKYFGIPVLESARHTALGDARATAYLYTALRDELRKFIPNWSSLLSVNSVPFSMKV
jgi:DNA polymerase III epsilon subunit-like protein